MNKVGLMNENIAARAEGERDLFSTRFFDAPPDLVFDTWLDPEHISRWWGPRGFTTTTSKLDPRPGGEWIFVMHGPDGSDYENKVVYVELERPRHLSYRHLGTGDNEGIAFFVTVNLIERDGGTELQMRMQFETGEMRDEAARFGAVEGLDDTLSRLAEYLEAQ